MPVELEPVALTFTPEQRESFFDSIARHQRAALRVALVADACAFALAFVVAVLMAPLLYAVLGLLLDAVNLLLPTPDLIGMLGNAVVDLTDDLSAVPAWRWIYIALIASLPGLAVMALAWRTLGRLMREAMTNPAIGFKSRAPNPDILAEQRFSNVVSEMAIAAGLSAPRVLVTESEAVNAAAFGPDAAHASVVITTGLLAEANRAELQGVAAQLVGAIANGDMAIGTRVATMLGMFGLIAKLSESFGDRDAAKRFGRLLRRALRPGASAADGQLAMALTNPFHDEAATKTATRAQSTTDSSKVPWRTIAWMPLVGPLVIAGFFGALLCAIALGPLLAVSWRRRKYMADATAVRLTRDPDSLGSALEKIRGMPVDGAFGNWIAHLCVVPSPLLGTRSILGGSSVPMSPSLDRRLKALGVMGATVAPRVGRRPSALMWCLLAPVLALLAALMSAVVFGLLYVSVALSGLFTWLPAVLIHALLR